MDKQWSTPSTREEGEAGRSEEGWHEEKEEEQVLEQEERNNGSCARQRGIEEVGWDATITGRTVKAGDFNAQSPLWNNHCQTRKNAHVLENVIETYGLLIANDYDSVTYTRLDLYSVSTIDLTLHTSDITVTAWAIGHEHPTSSDHKLLTWEIDNEQSSRKTVATSNGWSITDILENESKMLKFAG